MFDEFQESFARVRRTFYILAFALILAGTAAGAFFLVYRYGGSEDIRSYLGGVTDRFNGGVDRKNVIFGAAKDCAAVLAVFFICGFVKPGVFVIAAELIRRGFVTGFTVAAFIEYYSGRGLLLAACMLPRAVILIPALAMVGSVNAALAVNSAERTKNFKIFYIFFLLASASIFCAFAICEGFLTTTFMKWAFAGVT